MIKIKKNKLGNLKNKREKTFFLIKFSLIFLALELLVSIINPKILGIIVANLVAKITNSQNIENFIIVDNYAYEITNFCTGLTSIIAFIAIVVPLKKPDTRKKVEFIIVASIAIFILNISRVSTIILVAKRLGNYYGEITHIVSWFLMFFAVFLIWYYLAQKTGKISEMI
ncbi:MAG: exosortase/archaeosortase family protein [Candidatus Diapherotrites archaeon]|nr:exosortase/archaeosortase family protein [Candidatus Diapherotrites archaeon]